MRWLLVALVVTSSVALAAAMSTIWLTEYSEPSSRIFLPVFCLVPALAAATGLAMRKPWGPLFSTVIGVVFTLVALVTLLISSVVTYRCPDADYPYCESWVYPLLWAAVLLPVITVVVVRVVEARSPRRPTGSGPAWPDAPTS